MHILQTLHTLLTCTLKRNAYPNSGTICQLAFPNQSSPRLVLLVYGSLRLFFPPQHFGHMALEETNAASSLQIESANHKRHGLVRRLSNSRCDCLNQSLDQNAICCLDEPQRLRFRKTSLAFYCVFVDARPMTLLSTPLWLLTSTVRPRVRLLSWSRVSPSVCFHLPSDAYFV